MQQAELPPNFQTDLARLLGDEIRVAERIGGGRNSQVYRVEMATGDRCALKIYFQNPADSRDRLGTEFESLRFLWENAVHDVPQPLVKDSGRGWGVYQFIEGEKVPPPELGEHEVLCAADFLFRLRELSRKQAATSLGVASEAFFSVSSLAEILDQRLLRLKTAQDQTPTGRLLQEFLDAELVPFLAHAKSWSEKQLKAQGTSFETELSKDQRTISPSDFGYHNALRQPDGRIIFLDFEYFGWDDPAKMIVDFVLHPAMDLSPRLRTRFASTLFERFADLPSLRGRVEAVFPLLGVKWCLILLNEFLPDALLRRQFASHAKKDPTVARMNQLGKAKKMLNDVRAQFELPLS
jgi:hypothetical protein